ncbi:MAG: NADH-quinone oxidoreductase subunit I [Anaerolineae bacterium]|nr:NADH-quinone oxidoreductase subunit I [Anaerolineae bacterium]MDW8098907.1 NADH-quinone oxidoreductase subunit I [Anaerolineae bacterium]
MFGIGVLKGLGVTMKHLIETYVDDVRKIPSRYAGGRQIVRQMPDEEGIFTIQYPEEKRLIPERFRYIPMLLFDPETGEDRCTACGICAKVCPPQCIWIVRDQDEHGKPITRPAEFYIDVSICMSCGFCAEFCPFDAIKMNHDFELSVYSRYPQLIYDKQALSVPVSYYAALYPNQYAAEEAARAEKEKAKAERAERKTEALAPSPEQVASVAASPRPRLTPEEIERRKAEAAARRAQRQTSEENEA